MLGKTEPIKLVLVGLPNAGKSTLLNRLLGFERVLTGPEPALTRDAVVADLEWRGWRFEVTDTAGWLKSSTLQNYDENGGKVAAMTVSQVLIHLYCTSCIQTHYPVYVKHGLQASFVSILWDISNLVSVLSIERTRAPRTRMLSANVSI